MSFTNYSDFDAPHIRHVFCFKNMDDHTGLTSVRLAYPDAEIRSVKQIHSDICVKAVKKNTADLNEADALVTDEVGIALSIQTADCAPVLFHGVRHEDNKPVIGAAHAGWRGAIGGILENTIDAMIALGADKINACIGPCIRQQSYEVSGEFKKEFLEENKNNEIFFIQSDQEGHFMFDLPGYVISRLKKAGIDQVYDIGHNTYEMEDTYHSYRRATHRKKLPYRERQYSSIIISES